MLGLSAAVAAAGLWYWHADSDLPSHRPEPGDLAPVGQLRSADLAGGRSLRGHLPLVDDGAAQRPGLLHGAPDAGRGCCISRRRASRSRSSLSSPCGAGRDGGSSTPGSASCCSSSSSRLRATSTTSSISCRCCRRLRLLFGLAAAPAFDGAWLREKGGRILGPLGSRRRAGGRRGDVVHLQRRRPELLPAGPARHDSDRRRPGPPASGRPIVAHGHGRVPRSTATTRRSCSTGLTGADGASTRRRSRRRSSNCSGRISERAISSRRSGRS